MDQHANQVPHQLGPISDSQDKFVIVELTSAQLNERVGPPDPTTGLAPTRLEELQRAHPDMTVLPRMGPELSDEAQQANNRNTEKRHALERAGALAGAAALAGGLIYAVVAFKKKKQSDGSSQ